MPIQTTQQDLAQRPSHSLARRQHPCHEPCHPLRLQRLRGHPLLRTAHGSAVFRLPSTCSGCSIRPKSNRMHIPYTLEELCAGVVDTIEANGVAPCYIGPSCCAATVKSAQPKGSPIEV